MYYEDHNPPHFHAEYQGKNAVFDFNGNVLRGSLYSKTATKLAREWIDLHLAELEVDWELARAGKEITYLGITSSTKAGKALTKGKRLSLRTRVVLKMRGASLMSLCLIFSTLMLVNILSPMNQV